MKSLRAKCTVETLIWFLKHFEVFLDVFKNRFQILFYVKLLDDFFNHSTRLIFVLLIRLRVDFSGLGFFVHFNYNINCLFVKQFCCVQFFLKTKKLLSSDHVFLDSKVALEIAALILHEGADWKWLGFGWNWDIETKVLKDEWVALVNWGFGLKGQN